MTPKNTRDKPDLGLNIPSFRLTLKQIVIALMISFTVAAFAYIYLNTYTVTNFGRNITEKFITTTGLGLVILIAWLIFSIWITKTRQIKMLFRKEYGKLIGAVGFSTIVWGILGLYSPSNGFPGWTTMSLGVPIGGTISVSIIGETLYQTIPRLCILAVTSFILIKPSLVKIFLKGSRATAITCYLGTFAIYRAISRLYSKVEPQRSLSDPHVLDQPSTTKVPPELMSPHIRESEIIANLDDMRVEIERNEDGNMIETDEYLGEKEKRLGYFVGVDTSKDDETTNTDSVPDSTQVDDAHKFIPKDKIIIQKNGNKFNRLWSDDSIQEEENVPETSQEEKTRADTWLKPDMAMLVNLEEGGISKEEIQQTSEVIKTTFAEYRIEVEVEKVRPGPTVTMYGIEPGWVRKYKRVRVKDEKGNPKLDSKGKPIIAQQEDNTRVSVDNILRREKDLSLALKTPSLRIETPVMGESLLGIEVPNPNPSLVSLRRVMESKKFLNLTSSAVLPVALGRGSDGEEVVFDLAKMPHLLIAGATGSGKSVCMNAIISCLTIEKTPSDIQMLLIDPKRVELTPYNGIPHLITPVVVETDKVVNLLKGLIREMMDRYRTMEEVGVRNIQAYNSKSKSGRMPYIVVAIDELADLMMTAAFDVEQSICRLAQLGRATGIHLIIATQRPSVDVITGLIKANFPSRISFGVTSQVDSRTILDTNGAERLLGRGDMLYQPIDATRPTRVQSVYISDEEIGNLVDHWKDIPWGPKPTIDLHIAGDDSSFLPGQTESVSNTKDALVDRAIEMAQRHSKLSTSLLQRRLRIGYPRAARLMDELEDMGIVSPSDGSKSRDVIIS